MHRIQVPAQINAAGLLPFLSQLKLPDDREDVSLNFSQLRRVTSAGLVALAAVVNRWRRDGRKVQFHGLSRCAMLGYLQRMDVLKVCDVPSAEDFQRHDAFGRFVPVRQVDHPVEELGSAISSCLAPGGEDYDHPMAGLYDFSFYVMTEIANNVRQHSAGLGSRLPR